MKGKMDTRYDVHEVALQAAVEGEYDLVLIENVLDYPMEQQCARLSDYDWRISRNVDPLRLGYPLSRPRSIAVGLKKQNGMLVWSGPSSLDEMLEIFECSLGGATPTTMYFVLTDTDIHKMYGDWYDIKLPGIESLAPSYQECLKEYAQEHADAEVVDLSQHPSRGRTKASTGKLMCFTTNTAHLYNQRLRRILFPEEALLAMGVPVLPQAAETAGVQQFTLTDTFGKDISFTAKSQMAGNGCFTKCSQCVLFVS